MTVFTAHLRRQYSYEYHVIIMNRDHPIITRPVPLDIYARENNFKISKRMQTSMRMHYLGMLNYPLLELPRPGSKLATLTSYH